MTPLFLHLRFHSHLFAFISVGFTAIGGSIVTPHLSHLAVIVYSMLMRESSIL